MDQAGEGRAAEAPPGRLVLLEAANQLIRILLATPRP
jgi:hypothetical protein